MSSETKDVKGGQAPKPSATGQTLRSLLDAIYSSLGGLTTTASYIDALEERCIELRERHDAQVELVEELSDINGRLMDLLRVRGVQVKFGPVVDGKATWGLMADAREAEQTRVRGWVPPVTAAAPPIADTEVTDARLNLYRVTPLDPSFGGYDTYDSFIAAAASIEEARAMHPGDGSPLDTDEWGTEFGGRGTWVNKAEETKAELIGTAEEGVAPGVVLASYNAG